MSFHKRLTWQKASMTKYFRYVMLGRLYAYNRDNRYCFMPIGELFTPVFRACKEK